MAITTDVLALRLGQRLVAHGVAIDDVETFADDFAPDLVEWLGGEGAVPAALATKVTTTAAAWNTDVMQRIEWWTGTVDGGPNGDGMYPMTNAAGVTTLFPSLAKILDSTAKGNAGWTAKSVIEPDGSTRAVLRIVDWTGGEGTKPAIGYVAEDGSLVGTAAAARDVFGGISTTLGDLKDGAEDAAEAAANSAASVADVAFKQARRFLFRRALTHLFDDADGKALGGFTADDGTLLAKLPVFSPDGSLSIVRSNITGLYALALGLVKTIALQGATLATTAVEYFARKKVLFSVKAAGKTALMAITDDGWIRGRHALVSGAGMATTYDYRQGTTALAWGTAAEDRPLGGGANVSTKFRRFYNRELLTHEMALAGRHLGLGVSVSGTTYIPKPYMPGVRSPGPPAIAPDGTLIRAEKRGGLWRLIKTSPAGVQSIMTTVGNCAEPVIEGATVIYRSDRGRTFPNIATELWCQPIAGGEETPVYPFADFIATFGDSMSQNTYQPGLATDLGVPIKVSAYGGQNGKMIAMRQGGLNTYLTITSGTLGVGANPVSFIASEADGSDARATGGAIGDADSPLLYSSPATTAAISGAGWLVIGGERYKGVLTRTVSGGNELYSFVPTTNLALPVSAPALSRFIPETAEDWSDRVQGIWALTNDVLLWDTPEGRARSVARFGAMVAHAKALRRRFWGLGPTIQDTFPAGNAYHTGFNLVRAQLAANHPEAFIDIHALMVSEGLTRAGLSPTPDDTADIANDLVPRQLRTDLLHFNDPGKAVVRQIVKEFVQAKGWLS